VLWPTEGGLEPPDPAESTRLAAIAEVLCHIPHDDYQILADSIDSWMWFLPPVWQNACIRPFPVTAYPEPDAKTGLQRNIEERWLNRLALNLQLLAVIAEERAAGSYQLVTAKVGCSAASQVFPHDPLGSKSNLPAADVQGTSSRSPTVSSIPYTPFLADGPGYRL